MKYVKVSSIVVFMMLLPFVSLFVYHWTLHMENVRSMHDLTFKSYSSRSIDWNEIDTSDHKLLFSAATNNINFLLHPLVHNVAEKRNDLRFALFNVAILVNPKKIPNSQGDMSQHVIDNAVASVANAQSELYAAEEKFQTDWGYAMLSTF